MDDDQKQVHEFVKVFENASILVRENMAVPHLWTAKYMAHRCAALEEQLRDGGKLEFNREHRSLAISAVIFSVCFLEAYINEVFADLADKNPVLRQRLRGLPPGTADLISDLWKADDLGVDRLSILSKYQFALVCAGKPRMDEGATTMQRAKKLIQLRNGLVHFRPRWQDGLNDDALTLKLKEEKFPINSLLPDANPWYPNQCFGAGCAAWAYEASSTFAVEWASELDLEYDFRMELDQYPID